MELLWIPFVSILTKKKNKWKIIWVPIFFDDGQPIRPFQYRFGVIEKDKWIKFWRSTWCRLRVLPTFFFYRVFFSHAAKKKKVVPLCSRRKRSFFFVVGFLFFLSKFGGHVAEAEAAPRLRPFFLLLFGLFRLFFLSLSLSFYFFLPSFPAIPPPHPIPIFRPERLSNVHQQQFSKCCLLSVCLLFFLFLCGVEGSSRNSFVKTLISFWFRSSTIDIFLGDFFCFLFKKKKCRIEAVVAAEVGELLFFFCRNLKDFFVRC